MISVRMTADSSSEGVRERDFVVGEIPGVLWSPSAPEKPTPLVLMGHGGGQDKRTPAQVARARDAVLRHGFSVVAIDAPGHGDRPRRAVDERARTELRQAMTDGDTAG